VVVKTGVGDGGEPAQASDVAQWCKVCGAFRWYMRSHVRQGWGDWIQPWEETNRACLRLGILEVWEWLAGRHDMGTEDALARVRKAETCAATLAEWETKHPEGARVWTSDALVNDLVAKAAT
jgi:hypothetical protein